MDQSNQPNTPLVADPVLLTGARPSAATAWRGLRSWSPRRWAVALAGAAATVVVVGLSTAMIPNPVFGRSIETTAWAWPVLVVTGVLAGLLGATYVRGSAPAPAPTSRSAAVGGVLAWFAVGCPVCNKIALLALGYTGALQWFAPMQPWLAAAGLALLGYALHRRVLGEIACALPARS